MKDLVVTGGIFREILDGNTAPRPRLAGSGLTSGIVAARLGAATGLASYVGDEDAQTVLDMLAAAGVDSSSLAILPGASGTFVFPAEVEGSPPWPMYRPAEATPTTWPTIEEATLYLVFGIPDIDPIAEGWLDGLPNEAVLLWDRQGWMSRARDCRGAGSLPPRERVYVANLEEAVEEFPPQGAEALARLPPEGFSAAVVKQGVKGCTVIRGGSRTTFDAFRVDNITSTIGSGDAFAGGLAAALSSGAALDSAVLVANAAAAAFLQADGDPLVDWFPDRVRLHLADRGNVGREAK